MAETVKLTGPIGIESIGIGGKQYDVVGGIVEVPSEHAAELLGHGFVPWSPPPGSAAPAPAPAAPQTTLSRTSKAAPASDK